MEYILLSSAVQSEPTDGALIANIKAHLSISGNNLTVSMGASPTIETEVRILVSGKICNLRHTD